MERAFKAHLIRHVLQHFSGNGMNSAGFKRGIRTPPREDED
jgi:hypothetical protein